jgi:hypothetical protein
MKVFGRFYSPGCPEKGHHPKARRDAFVPKDYRTQPGVLTPPGFAPSSETPDFAPSSKLRKAMSGEPGGYVGQDLGELSRAAVLESGHAE